MSGEEATRRSKEYAVLMWDLMKAFELVGHVLFIREAEACCSPIGVLRIMIRAYRWPRAIVVNNVAAKRLWPRQGIPAGCFSTTYTLRCFLQRTLL